MASSDEILCAGEDECLHPRRRPSHRARTEGATPRRCPSIVVAARTVPAAVVAAVPVLKVQVDLHLGQDYRGENDPVIEFGSELR